MLFSNDKCIFSIFHLGNNKALLNFPIIMKRLNGAQARFLQEMKSTEPQRETIESYMK